MGRQVSTALSDLVLSLSAAWGFQALNTLRVDHRFGKWWFMLQALAAALGVVRFGALLPRYEASVIRYHNNFSWLCRAIGVPCLAAEVCIKSGYTAASQGFLISAVAGFVASSLKSRHKDRIVELVNILSVLTILGLSVAAGNLMFAWAGILFILSALLGSEGEIALISTPRVDLFHYTLVAVNYCMVGGFKH